MTFGSLDLNNLVLMIIAGFTLANTVIVGYNARQNFMRTELAKRAVQTAIATHAVAAETRQIAIETQKNTNGLVAKLMASEKEVSRREGVDEGKKETET